jgi:probable rRNA maturation factor
MNELILRNRQRTRPVNLRVLRRVARAALAQLPGVAAWELGLHLVSAGEITRLNRTFLGHDGATDVIAFDHAERPAAGRLHGEVFICLDEAVGNARAYRTTWQTELARYVIHGLLHLRGHDDREPAARRRMKRTESRLLQKVAKCVPLSRLERRRK